MRMKQNMYKALSVCLLLGWMAVIFLFSAQPAEESSAMSGGVVSQLVEGAERVSGREFSEQERFQLAEKLSFPVRKAAHMTEYAILALLAFCFFRNMGTDRKLCVRLSLLLAVCYAVTDEIHQIFVPGREGMLFDVCVDAAGAWLGLLCLKLVYKKRQRKLKTQ